MLKVVAALAVVGPIHSNIPIFDGSTHRVPSSEPQTVEAAARVNQWSEEEIALSLTFPLRGPAANLFARKC